MQQKKWLDEKHKIPTNKMTKPECHNTIIIKYYKNHIEKYDDNDKVFGLIYF